MGIYAYRPEVLLDFSKASPTPLERVESLEQLRLLENGYKVLVVQVPSDQHTDISVDTLEDLETARYQFSLIQANQKY